MSLTIEEKIFWLQILLDVELEKPFDKKDIKKINRYVDELLVLHGKKNNLSLEEVQAKESAIPFK